MNDDELKSLNLDDLEDNDIEVAQDGSEEPGGDFAGSEEDLEATELRLDTKLVKVRKELEQARKEKQENLDGWQRAKADYVNALKRFEEEKKFALSLGTLKAAVAFLPVIDSLERAKASSELPEGFEGIVKQLEGAIAKLGIEPFGAVGEKFDPMLHEALGQDPAESAEDDDHITAILESGWKMGEQVVRPAKVRVSHFEG
jgi:molecular chaperone GrpE